MGLTTHCTVEPPCRYCWNSSTINRYGFGPENVLTIDEIVEGARLIEETGISGSIHGIDYNVKEHGIFVYHPELYPDGR